MKKFVLKRNGENEPIATFSTKIDAVEEMEHIIEDNNEDYDSDEDEYLTPFDFILEEIECKEVNEFITNFEEARKHLGGKPNADFIVSKKILSGNCVNLEDVTRLVTDINPKHLKALIALNKLFTIAQAWNKEDGFEPDFSNRSQTKWFPWFVYSDKAAGFVFAYANHTATTTNATIGSRLCFKTSARARQFGEQFIDLWNQVLLFR